jgi:acyl carrier protein
MDADALATLLDDDTARGFVPVLIVATAGTTNAGMIDPIGRCADLAHERGLWLHVDAAWGGAVLASDQLRGALAGIERASSVTIDAHKWFATTMGCGMFITRDPEILSTTFQVSTGFMPSNTATVDPYVTTAQWSRRFLGVRLFLSLAAAGWSGYAQHVERAVELIARLRDTLATRDWRIANDSSLAVLCVEPPPGAPAARTIASRVLASGRAWVAVAKYEGRDVIRICLTHGEATMNDIHELVGALTDACHDDQVDERRNGGLTASSGNMKLFSPRPPEGTSMAASIRTTIISHFEQVGAEQRHKLAELTDDRPLMDSGLDSLAFAIVVARLEDALGIDPFSASEDAEFPVTFGDFVQMYEKMSENAVT